LIGAGYRVALSGRREEALRETAADGRASDVLVVPTDVREPAAVAALFVTVKRALGRVDVLFNNAGLFGPTAPVEDMPRLNLDPPSCRGGSVRR
jgi:NAD(P)-dependent dehydrogenase (short-subunit alcohol dehydrogenase family)